MRASRAKQAAPGLYPENTPGYRKPPPVYDKIKGVPMTLAFKLADHILRHGRHDREENTYDMEIGGQHFSASLCEREGHYGKYWHSFNLGGNSWSCSIHLSHWPMGGDGCYMLYGKYYVVSGYTMWNKKGWVRDMTIAQMCIDEWPTDDRWRW